MESPDAKERSKSPVPARIERSTSRSRSQSLSRDGSASPPRKRERSLTPVRRSYSRSRSPRRHRSRSGSSPGGYSRRRRSRSRSPMSSRRRHHGNRDDPVPSKCLGVFGLSLYTTERELQSIFGKFGPLDRVQVVLDAKTGKSRGFAFVYFESVKDASDAKEECSGMEIDGRRIRVDFSITQRPHTPTPGIYMGRPTTSGDGGRSGGGGRGPRDRGYGGSRSYGRYRSPSPKYRRGRRDSYDRSYDRERSPYDRYERDRSRSRSYSPRHHSRY